MNNKKLIKIILLCLTLTFSGVGATYSYFVHNEKVENSINVSVGTIKSDFIDSNTQTPITFPIVNISGLLPGETQTKNYNIKNIGSLTSKVAFSLDNFTESEKDTLIPYLNFKIEAGSNLLYDGSLKDYINSSDKILTLKDQNNDPILLKSNSVVEVKLSFTLQNTVPYIAEGKSLKFNINIHSTQPNDPQWSYNN
ncbi:TasA family protein [Clostridium sp. 'White wine YQ']|uniref:TasA family protein n=1 Tax=Clostridium sp. 'White wine YQ' TaxID=3027474 RepID=UPI0023652C6B|nr:TasA family protein [Clostridium sp. 'White wine YQ']MDD7792789.1 TasA family protein [Clostridium sp. 'White wine YQ']